PCRRREGCLRQSSVRFRRVQETVRALEETSTDWNRLIQWLEYEALPEKTGKGYANGPLEVSLPADPRLIHLRIEAEYRRRKRMGARIGLPDRLKHGPRLLQNARGPCAGGAQSGNGYRPGIAQSVRLEAE